MEALFPLLQYYVTSLKRGTNDSKSQLVATLVLQTKVQLHINNAGL